MKAFSSVFWFFWLAGNAAAAVTANVLKSPAGGRAAAMGEAQTAAVGGPLSLYWNPAGLGGTERAEVALAHGALFEGLSQDLLAVAWPTGRGVWAGGVAASRLDDVAAFDRDGRALGAFNVGDTLLSLGWGRAWDPPSWPVSLRGGVGAKLLRKKLGTDSASAFMGDAGVLAEWTRAPLGGLRLAGALENAGPRVTFDRESDPLPFRWKLGLAWSFLGDGLLLTEDWVHPRGGRSFVNAGLEYRLNGLVAFRGGYKGTGDARRGPTYGVGLGREDLRVDYAFASFGELGDAHRVSLGFQFGPARARRGLEAKVRESHRRALAAQGRGDLLGASVQAAAVLEAAPWHRESKRLLGRLAADFELAEEDSLRREQEAQAKASHEEGVRLFNAGEFLRARDKFQESLAASGGAAAARDYLRRIEGHFHVLAEQHREAATGRMAAGEYEEARAHFQQALVLEPEDRPSRDGLAEADASLARADALRAEEDFRKGFERAEQAFAAGLYEKAVAGFEALLENAPGSAEVRRSLALSRGRLADQHHQAGLRALGEKKRGEAAGHFQYALRLDPGRAETKKMLDELRSRPDPSRREEADALYKLGLEALSDGEAEKARELWTRVLAADPTHVDAKQGLEMLSAR